MKGSRLEQREEEVMERKGICRKYLKKWEREKGFWPLVWGIRKLKGWKYPPNRDMLPPPEKPLVHMEAKWGTWLDFSGSLGPLKMLQLIYFFCF